MQSSPRFLLLFSLTIFSCIENNQKQQPKTATHIASVDTSQKELATKNLLLKNDTLVIETKSAVFYQPDSFQIKRRMKEVGEENFRAGADDYIYYINTSVDYLEKQGLPVVDAKNKKYLQFSMADKQARIVKIDTLSELWGMYLFDPTKTPHFADITLIDEEYKKYFK